jgi:hypothetical protein
VFVYAPTTDDKKKAEAAGAPMEAVKAMTAAEKMQKSQEELKEHARLMALFEMQEAAERKKEAQKRLIEEIKQRCLFAPVNDFGQREYPIIEDSFTDWTMVRVAGSPVIVGDIGGGGGGGGGGGDGLQVALFAYLERSISHRRTSIQPCLRICLFGCLFSQRVDHCPSV